MIVLGLITKIFRSLYVIYSEDQVDNFRKRFILNFKAITLGVLELFLVIPSCAFFLSNITKLSKATESMYCIAAFGISCSMHCLFIANRQALMDLLRDLQELVNERIKACHYNLYEAIESATDRYTKRFTIFIFVSCSIVLTMPITIAIFTLLSHTYSFDNWYLPFKAIMPYERTHLGFALAYASQLIIGEKFCVIFCPINTFFIGTCWYIGTFFNDLKGIFRKIDKILLVKNKNGKIIMNKGALVKAHLIEIIDFHNKILVFREKFAEFVSGSIFLAFSIGTLWLCTAINQFQTFNIHTLDLGVVQNMVANMLIIVWLYIYCYFGQKVTSTSLDVADMAYNSLFYKYPIRLRFYLVLIMARSQKPFFIKGYKMTHCSLESFAKLINMAISIFMIFRRLQEH